MAAPALLAVLVVAAAAVPRAAGFPQYDSVQTAEPPVPFPAHGAGSATAPPRSTTSCTVQLIQTVGLSGYGQIEAQPWRGAPAACPPPWSMVKLAFEGAVSGVQFDRFGALWFDGVELLRTTTPEPDTGVAPGVRWGVEKDVTDYASLFTARAGSANATVTIPNVVNPTYTGIEYVRATLAFTSPSSTQPPPGAGAGAGTFVAPLADRRAIETNPFAAMAITMPNVSLAHTVSVGPAMAGRVAQAFVDVYVTNHGGSEEFWYTTGSAYREVDLYIDGCLAGAFYPFPVVYSGGVNPLLWRPLTSVLTLNVPAYRLDITPFAGALNDGRPHTFEFRVFGADPVGVWYVDPVLVLRLQGPGLPRLSGGLTSQCHGYLPNDPARVITVVNSTAGRSTAGPFMNER